MLYQATPCAGGAGERVRDLPGLNRSPGLRRSEAAWLTKRAKQRPRRPAKPQRAGGGKAQKRRQAQQCWKKEQQLDAVRARLRRGYKASAGERLRRQRRSYEDYLRRFCD